MLPSDDAAVRHPLAARVSSPTAVPHEAGGLTAECADLRVLQPLRAGGALA